MPLVSPPETSEPTAGSATPPACDLHMAMVLESGSAMIGWHCCSNSTNGERECKATGGRVAVAHCVGCCVFVCMFCGKEETLTTVPVERLHQPRHNGQLLWRPHITKSMILKDVKY